MKTIKYSFKKLGTQLLDIFFYLFTLVMTGIRAQPITNFSRFKPKVFYANHTSNGDLVMIWGSIPYQIRKRLHPVAAHDYWTKTKIRYFIVMNTFRAILIKRDGSDSTSATELMSKELRRHHSIIIFPEGKRNTDDDTLLLPFKSGIYHIAKENPQTEFVPVWVENVHKLLPKGKLVPIPIKCDVYFGKGVFLDENETKDEFLEKTRDALLKLAIEKGEQNEE